MQLGVILLLLLAVAAAKKSQTVDPDILNPDEESGDPKNSPEYQLGSKFVEGDMVVKGADKNNRNAVGNTKKLWPGGVVPYIFAKGVTQDLKDVVEKAIADYHTYTCIRWKPRQSEENYVYFTNGGGGCYAFLGVYGGHQPVNLGQGCETKGIAIHEMAHTLGFAHEQSRNDRDRYIRINWHNMKSGAKAQFEKLTNENNQGFPYDLKSIMHYGPWGFSANGRRVIDTLDSSMRNVIGQRKGFSKQDAQEINSLYRCSGSRPAPPSVTDAPIAPEDCKDAAGNYCYNQAVTFGYESFCESPTYAAIAKGSCPRYCRLC